MILSNNQNISACGNGAPHEPSTGVQSTTRLIVLDRRALIRECISSCLRMLPRNIEILPGAGVAEGLQADDLAHADILMLCTNLSPADNETVQREITSLFVSCPDLSIVLVADSRDADEARYLVARWRLRGYIPTSSTLAEVEAALDLVLAGGTYLPPDGHDGSEGINCAKGALDRMGGAKLTERERAVLFFLRGGMPNKLIAHRLGISQCTVKAHIHSILTKLHTRNRTEAAVLASEGFVTGLSGEDSIERFAVCSRRSAGSRT